MGPEKNPEEIFNKAVDVSDAAERAAYLDEACGSDEKLRAEVEALLKWHMEAGDFLEAPVADPDVTLETSAVVEGSGTVIGRYKLLEKVGEGGMATVYMAEQKRPIRRRVALKIIKLGMDTKQVIGRFETERQALAMMDHPNIAKVLDAGTTETGRPYFVMELVRGVPITEFCDSNHLTPQERLELFISVCQAVQHAHQKGIIHRDIKPSNIMVTLHDGEPVVKVIDFGIAKAVNQQLTEKTVFTRYSQMIGTPEYMSPEQAEMSGLDIDTRTDVFSLGVLLYELLTGMTPFDSEYLLGKGYGEMQRIIREEEPTRPSTKLSTLGETLTDVAKHRKTSPELLCKLIRTDLDWIVMKTLEKDRSRRYESVSELAADIKRHLKHEPVLAGRPSTVYRIHKFVKRNRVFVASVVTVSLVVVLATIVSLVLAFTATRAKKDAEQARNAEQKQKVAFQEEAKRATEAEQRENQLRLVAQKQEFAARRRAYAADMLLCQQALADNNLRRARQLLDRQRPEDREQDLRGWEWRHLWGCCRGDALLKLDMQGRYGLKAALINDNENVVTFTGEGRVSCWDLHTGEEVTLQDASGGMGGGSGHLCVSADGQWIVSHNLSESKEHIVRIWDTNTRNLIAELPTGMTWVRCLALSPDKKAVAVLAPNEGVSIWDVSAREKRMHIPLSLNEYYMFSNALSYSPDGTILAFGDNSGMVRLIDAETGFERNVFAAGSDKGVSVMSLRFSPNGRFLAVGTGFTGPSLSIWDTELDTRVTTLTKHTGFVAGLAFSPDGQYLASASGDQTIKLWNARDWSEEATLLGHTDEVWSVEFSRDGERLVSCGKDGYVCVWDMSITGKSRGSITLPAEIKHADVSPDGKTIVGVSSEGQVQLLDAATLQKKVVPKSLGNNNVAAFWVSTNSMLIGCVKPPQVKVWDLLTNTLSTFELDLKETEPIWDYHTIFDYLPSCQILSVVGCDPNFERVTITRWDVSTYKELSSYTIDEDIWDVAISQDARWAAAVWRPHRVEILDLSTGERVSDFATVGGANQGLALFTDGQLVATAGVDEPVVHVWDVPTQQEVVYLHGHNLVISDMKFSLDGRRLATSTIGMEPIKLWDTGSWEEVCNLNGDPSQELYGAQFLTDGDTIAGRERNVEKHTEHLRLWRAPSWEEIEKAESVENVERQSK